MSEENQQGQPHFVRLCRRGHRGRVYWRRRPLFFFLSRIKSGRHASGHHVEFCLGMLAQPHTGCGPTEKESKSRARRKNPRAGLGGCTRLKQGGWGGKKALSQLSHPGGSPWLSSGWSTPQQQNNDRVPEQAADADRAFMHAGDQPLVPSHVLSSSEGQSLF